MTILMMSLLGNQLPTRRIAVDATATRIECCAHSPTCPDVRNALANCRSVKAQVIDGETRYRATGKDTEGRTITVVVELYETALRICVVTAWKGDRK
jgi:hypothetical protein